MRFISIILICSLLVSSCVKKSGNACELYPPYKLMIEYSKRIQSETHLVLTSYGINCRSPKNYQSINGIGNFLVSYSLNKSKQDEISVDYARNLIVFVAEGLLKEINAKSDVISDLDMFPFVSDLLTVTIHFEDENQIDLGQGVAIVHLLRGKIKYEGYDIHEYTNRYPAIGKHYTIHEESYAEALEIVKNVLHWSKDL